MRLWVDDIRPEPQGYIRVKSVNEAKREIIKAERDKIWIDLINLDHDAGDYFEDGGDYINLLDWLFERETFYPVTFHTANPVGRANMKRIVDRYWPDFL